jgi:hypothetical protein
VRRRVAEKNKEIEWLHRHGPEVVGRRHSSRRLPTRKAQPQTDHSRSRPAPPCLETAGRSVPVAWWHHWRNGAAPWLNSLPIRPPVE